MKRGIWNGSISFGLVHVPVQLFPATEDKSLHFHIMNKQGTCRLRQKLYCPDNNKEYDFGDTAKGFEISPGNYVLLDKEELKALKPETGSTIDIRDFIDIADVDPIFYKKSYYLVPAKGGSKPYQLLLKAMASSGKVALAQFVMRQKGYLAVIRPKDDVLCLETLYYAKELVDYKQFPGIAKREPLSGKELTIAKQLVETMTAPFHPEQYIDEYTEAVKGMVKRKAKGVKIATPESPAKTAKIINLMDALKQSLAQKPDKARKKLSQSAKPKRRSIHPKRKTG